MSFHPIFKEPLNKKNSIALDLSVNSPILNDEITSQALLGKAIFEHLNHKEKRYGFGGYLEKRNLYEKFENFDADDRNIHLGIDVWVNAEEPLFAPENGIVVVSHKHELSGDYGGLIILKHEQHGAVYHTLYGHLSQDSVENNPIKKQVQKGEYFARLGAFNENGNWPIHLHFQLIDQLNIEGNNYPGVCSEKQLEEFKTKCPNPAKLLGL